VQRNEDQIELDFDEINDLVNELKPDKSVSAKVEDIGGVNANNVHQNSNIQLVQQNAANENGVDQNDDIYANERDNSDCGTSQQPDYALDSTFQSYGLLDDDI